MDEIIKSVLLSGSVSAMLLALLLWLLRDWVAQRLAGAVAHEYNEELERLKARLNVAIEHYRTEFQQGLHVATSQFDMEFASCKSLWTAVSNAVDATARMINFHLEFGISENSERLKTLAKESDEAFFAAQKLVREVAPFIPARLGDLAQDLNARCKSEIDIYFSAVNASSSRWAELDSAEAHKQFKEARKAMYGHYKDLEAAIRARMQAMGGIPSP